MYIRNSPPVCTIWKTNDSLYLEKTPHALKHNTVYRNKAGFIATAVISLSGIVALFDAALRVGWSSLINESNLPFTYWILITPLGLILLISVHVNIYCKTVGWFFCLRQQNIQITSYSRCVQLSSAHKTLPEECILTISNASPPQDFSASQSLYILPKTQSQMAELDIQDSLLEAHDICNVLMETALPLDYKNTLIKKKPTNSASSNTTPETLPYTFQLFSRHTAMSLFIGGTYILIVLFFLLLPVWAIYVLRGQISYFFVQGMSISFLVPFIIIGTLSGLLSLVLTFSIKAAYLGLFPFFGTRTLTIHPDGLEFTERGLRKVRQHHRVDFDEITEVFVNEGELGQALHLFGKTHLVVRWDKASFAVLGDGMSVEELFELQAAIEHARNAYLKKHALAEPV